MIGAGWIGLEVTAAARLAGVEVTVVETAELPLLRVLGPEVAQVFADLHLVHGVDFRFNASLAEILNENGTATGVRLNDGTTIAADAVLVAVGAAPNVELGEAAGLHIDNGIVVDAALRTNDPNIFAAGDVANAFHPFFDRQIRVEHWANARQQPKAAAASMLGKDVSYDELPYFYTDQYDLGMEYVGYVEPDELRPSRLPWRRRRARVRRVLARERPRCRRHERQRVGCRRAHKGIDPVSRVSPCASTG